MTDTVLWVLRLERIAQQKKMEKRMTLHTPVQGRRLLLLVANVGSTSVDAFQ